MGKKSCVDHDLTFGSKLHEALRQIEQMRQRRKIGPPVNSGKHRQTTGLSEILDEELGFLD